jgi:ssDNA-binding replication factor A large subunit
MALSKDQILTNQSDTTVDEVNTPEWGEGSSVFVRSLSGNERDTYEQAIYEQGKGSFRGLRAKLVAIALCDETGEPMGFSEAEIEQLGNKNGAVIDRLFERVKAISGMGDDAVEQAEKN